MAITREQVEGWRKELKLQVKLQNGSHYHFGYVENPRLEVITRRDGTVHTTTYYVDGVLMSGGLDAAVQALNEPRAHPTKAQFPVRELLACVERELKFRRELFPRWVADPKRKFTQKDAELEIAKMQEIARLFSVALQNGADETDLLSRVAGGAA